MIHKCGWCRKLVAKEDRRKKPAKLVAQNGSTVDVKPGLAPRIHCGTCRKLTILMTGRM
jgi:hypothetical protein